MFRIFLSSVAFYAQAAAHTGYAAYLAARGRLTNAALVKGSHAHRRALESVGVRFDVSGADILDRLDGPVVFVANHMSALETQILPAVLDRAAPCTFVVKSSLLKYPVFSAVLRGFEPIVVDRADPRTDLRRVLDEGTERLRAGISVIIFPQAHRTPTFSRKAFNSIGMRLARAAGVPMVPVALDTLAWGQGRLLKDVGWINPARTVRFAIGSPIPIGDDPQAAHREVMGFIEAQIAAWSALPAGSPGTDAGHEPATLHDPLAIPVIPGPVTPAP